MKIINTSELNVNDIPEKYEWSSFSKFALTFDPIHDSNASDFYIIKLDDTPNINDNIVSIRGYLYRLQRINNQDLVDEPGLDKKVMLAYSILISKLNN